MNQTHNFVYFGTPEVARDTLAILVERGFVPEAVVTSPDAPQGRGLTLTPSPVKAAALKRNIRVMTPEKLDDGTVAAIRALGCDYAVVVAYGKIFPETLIASFPKGVLNIHYSLLPKYRGAAPLEAALLAGESVTGVTIQKMAQELDAGDILAQEETAIAPEETARELRPRLIKMGAQMLADTLPAFVRGEIVLTPQDATRATRAPKRKKEDGLLSLDAPAEENWNKYRAYADTIGTYFFENEKRVKITKASFKDGKFVIERVTPEGRRDMPYRQN
ncbi:MAG: methionyl-tRNA formyltransferase [Minisyncoccota bacterium]